MNRNQVIKKMREEYPSVYIPDSLKYSGGGEYNDAVLQSMKERATEVARLWFLAEDGEQWSTRDEWGVTFLLYTGMNIAHMRRPLAESYVIPKGTPMLVRVKDDLSAMYVTIGSLSLYGYDAHAAIYLATRYTERTLAERTVDALLVQLPHQYVSNDLKKFATALVDIHSNTSSAVANLDPLAYLTLVVQRMRLMSEV